MKSINRKLFFILLAGSLVTTFMVMPYAFSLIQDTKFVITPIILIAQTIQSLVLFAIAIFIGLKLAEPMGLGCPIITSALKGEKVAEKLKAIWSPAVGLGALAAGLIVLLSIPFGQLSTTFLKTEVTVSTWKSLLASFYGGVSEEILLRLFLMTVFVWLGWKIKKTSDNRPTKAIVWLAIILSAVIFGLGHLPITGEITAITPVVILRAIVLNGVGGVIFGWLYWKKGLEAAMISHFSADICLHVILPLVVVMF